MYDQKNRRNVERTLRDELQLDRARIQLGRISAFGLLEMSRQRIGVSFFETITEVCKNCNGTGYTRSVEILAVSILRAIRRACCDKQAGVIYIYTNAETIAYMLNFKKAEIAGAEKAYNVNIFMHNSDEAGSNGFIIKKRKKLSDFEKREIEMEVVTGKVNQLGLEKSFFDSYQEEGSKEEVGNNFKSNNNKKNKSRKNRNKKKFENKPQKKGFMGSLFSVFSK